MAQHALDPAYRRVSVEEFLLIDFGDAKAELEDGVIYMMVGGSEVHARIAANIVAWLMPLLRGSGRRPYGSDLGTRTGDHTIRYPDVSVHCAGRADRADDRRQLLGDPQVVFEILSPSTASYDQRVKLDEYKALGGVREIVLVDPDSERVRLLTRTPRNGWSDDWFEQGEDIGVPSLGITIPHREIVARD